MLQKLKLSQLVLIIVVLPMAMQLVFVSMIAVLVQEAEAEAKREAHAREVIMHLSEILHIATATAGGMAAYSMSRDRKYSASSIPMDDCLRSEFPQLRALLANEPDQLILLKRLEKSAYTVERHLAKLDRELSAPASFGVIEELRLLRPYIQKMTDDVGTLVDHQKVTESMSPKIQAEKREQLRATLIVFSISLAFLALGLAVVFNRRTTARLKVVVDNGWRLGIGKELNPPLAGQDEIANLDGVFHAAADALAEAESKERAMIENARDVICTLDASEKFTSVNVASLPVWGYEPDELIGKHLSEIVSPEDLEKTRQSLKRLMANEEVPEIENRIIKKDGTFIDVSWSLRWSQSARSLFCVAHDITERRELERLKQEFVAMVSHDLRTPLTAVRGTLFMLGEGVYGETSPQAKARIDLTQSSVDRLINLINDLLDIEKLEAGMMTMKLVPVDLSSLLEDSVEAVRSIAESKRIKLVCGDCNGELFGDKERLVQVLVNLISNAIKYSADGQSVTVEAHPYRDCWEIRVKDEGRGIPKAQLASVFERFKQVADSDGKRGKGTGLGLAISKAIVEAHEGEIGVLSEEGKGSVFYIRIPRVSDKLLAAAQRD